MQLTLTTAYDEAADEYVATATTKDGKTLHTIRECLEMDAWQRLYDWAQLEGHDMTAFRREQVTGGPL